MDPVTLRGKISVLAGKYKYVLLILLIGLVLMCIPQSKQEQNVSEVPVPVVQEDLSEQLEEILAMIKGVGKVRVMLTEASAAETVYQTDGEVSSSDSGSNTRHDTVIVTDANRAQTGLVKTVTPPVYLGAIIVCQGGDSPAIRLSVVEAVSAVTGISADRITVLKMK